ncbi:MAG: M3 family oligoendopeptidase, partial [Alphaproteobacteria bacterium]|nr:M3 family oligoendopeptidase [Alphaproteobacteria bacterium]
QSVQERFAAIAAHTVFFQLELNAIDEAVLAGRLEESERLRRYRPWLEQSRSFRPHQLSEDMERLLLDRDVVGSSAWTRLFDETLAALRFPFGDQRLTLEEALDRLSDPDGGVRRAAATTLSGVLGENARLFAHILNTLVKDKEIDDRWRGFGRSVSARNLLNQVEDEVIEALVAAVKRAYPSLSHRYYRLKAGWLGGEKLAWWDRNAPLPETDGRTFSWAEAKRLVLEAYGAFSPRMAALAGRFFDNAWIDASPRSGKASGAFSHPTVPGVHPYVLLNYQGRARDVATLAHELGHGVHQSLAAKQGYFLASTPLTLAETASVFGEMLTFRTMLKTAPPEHRRALLAGKVEDMLNTVVRQVAFYEFERRLHEARVNGELTVDEIGGIWMDTQRESLGDAFALDDSYSAMWAYISHFVHMPFYVYAYAFGDCLVNALYASYEEDREGFEAKYLDMLAAGGSKRHDELLAPFGLDARDPAFWDGGLARIAGLVDELEAA